MSIKYDLKVAGVSHPEIILGVWDDYTEREAFIISQDEARELGHKLIAAARAADQVTQDVESIMEEEGVSRSTAIGRYTERRLTNALTVDKAARRD